MTTKTSDTASVDIFGILSRDYLETLAPHFVDPSLVALAPAVTISYVGAQPAGTLVPLTSGARLALTHHYADAAVAPGRLDVVLVPGPDPRETWEDGALAWLRSQAHGAEAEAGNDTGARTTDVLSVCTGAYVCGRAGLLTAGRRVCGPRGFQADLRRTFEGVEWVGHERRWERDGNFWSSGAWYHVLLAWHLCPHLSPWITKTPLFPLLPTGWLAAKVFLFTIHPSIHPCRWGTSERLTSVYICGYQTGGITNGNDLVAAYCRESGRFDPQVVEWALAMADVGDRPQLYGDKGQ